jgi:hypothetical protein
MRRLRVNLRNTIFKDSIALFVQIALRISGRNWKNGMMLSQFLRKNGSRKAEDALLKALSDWIPPSTQVILATDAGFQTPWFCFDPIGPQPAVVSPHLPESPVSSYSRPDRICGRINSTKSRACGERYLPRRITTP